MLPTAPPVVRAPNTTRALMPTSSAVVCCKGAKTTLELVLLPVMKAPRKRRSFHRDNTPNTLVLRSEDTWVPAEAAACARRATRARSCSEIGVSSGRSSRGVRDD